jgi:uncharacterized protein (DUF433 family)
MPSMEPTRIDPGRGVYDASRAAALAGVPKSTLHYWARHEIWIPSIACEPRTRLWSWGDLVVLRFIHWLRADKAEAHASAMSEVRALASFLRSRQFDPSTLSGHVALRADGRLAWSEGGTTMLLKTGQGMLDQLTALVGASEIGPDLIRPRPGLRILPGKLSGEPHVAGTRILTAGLLALARRGYTFEEIRASYPELSEKALSEALDFEQSLVAA